MRTPDGLAVVEHDGRVGLLQRRDRGRDRLARADHRQRRRHVLLDRVGELRRAGEQRVEQVALD